MNKKNRSMSCFCEMFETEIWTIYGHAFCCYASYILLPSTSTSTSNIILKWKHFRRCIMQVAGILFLFFSYCVTPYFYLDQEMGRMGFVSLSLSVSCSFVMLILYPEYPNKPVEPIHCMYYCYLWAQANHIDTFFGFIIIFRYAEHMHMYGTILKLKEFQM